MTGSNNEGAKPAHARPVGPLPDKITIGEKYDPAMKITDQAEADAYFAACVEHCMRFDPKRSREEAESIERHNLGYYAGYYDEETAQRVLRLFGAPSDLRDEPAHIGAGDRGRPEPRREGPMKLRPVERDACPTEACIICRAPVYTCELGDCPDAANAAHMAGGQLAGGGSWVCSETCWETASEWPPKVNRERIVHRALGLFIVWFFVFALFVAHPMGWLRALALSMIVTALWGFVHWALTKLPAAPRGTFCSRGRP